jgi:hypothetical protein
MLVFIYSLSSRSIMLASQTKCHRGRKCSSCLNEFRCRDTMTVSDGPVAARHLREQLWSIGGTPAQRRKKLVAMLNSFVVVNSNDRRYIFCCEYFDIKIIDTLHFAISKSLKFQINGREVCKIFFRICSGINEKIFNESVTKILKV